MVLDDFVMLGTTVPEPCHDGRVFVCSAGWSAERRSLVRIYPLARRDIPRRWGTYRVPVELNPDDRRVESYKVAGDRSPGAHERINEQFVPVGALTRSQRPGALRGAFVRSIAEANERRLSLALIRPVKPEAMEVFFEHNPTSPLSPQCRLFEPPPPPGPPPAPGTTWAPEHAGSKRFPYLPRLRYWDQDGKHEHQLRDWGCYELMRKHQDAPAYFQAHMAEALHLGPGSCVLVGNMSHQRTAWLVIAVLNGLLEPRQLQFAEIED